VQVAWHDERSSMLVWVCADVRRERDTRSQHTRQQSSRATQSVTCSGLEMFLPIARAQSRARRQARLPDTCDCGAHQQLVDPLDARVGSLGHPRDERSSHLDARVRLEPAVWRQSSLPPPHSSHEFVAQFRVRTLQVYNHIRTTPVKGLRKGS
jgi:hypothetical protein